MKLPLHDRATLTDSGISRTRNGADRLASKLDEEAAERELLAALQTAIHSSCQRDRSAAQAIADTFRIDLATVYRWARGELACRPVQDFLDLQDAILRAKGSANPAALELARLVWRRYLAGDAETVTAAAAVTTATDGLRRVCMLIDGVVAAASANSPGGERIDESELPGLRLQWEAAHRSLNRIGALIGCAPRTFPVEASVALDAVEGAEV